MNFIKLNNKLLFIVLTLIITNCSDDKIYPIIDPIEDVDFVKTLGGSKNEGARSVAKTNDGGYAILGFTQSIDGDVLNKQIENDDFWLLKFDSQNILQWQKVFGGNKDDRGENIIQTSDGGYALIGSSKSDDQDATSNAGFQDVWVIKLDSSGEISWQKSIGFAGADQGYSILQTTDGGYFICGILDVTASGGLGNKKSLNKRHAGGDFWGIKLNSNGKTEWKNYFGGTNTDTCYDAIETNDGFMLIGSSDSNDVDIKNNKGGYDIWLVKINKTGDLIWEKSLGGKEIDAAYKILPTSDNNFILAGETRSDDLDITNQNGAADIWVLKIDPQGNIIWQNTLGGSSFDVARSVTNTQDGGYVLVGSSRSMDKDVSENKGQNDVWVIKIDDAGKMLWQKSIGGSEIDFAYGVTELHDGSIVVVGDTNSSDNDILENKGFTDLLIIKLD